MVGACRKVEEMTREGRIRMEEACYLVLKVSNNKQLLSVQSIERTTTATLSSWANRRFGGSEEYIEGERARLDKERRRGGWKMVVVVMGEPCETTERSINERENCTRGF